MQLISYKIIPPTIFPNIPDSKAQSHVYKLGISFCPTMDLVVTWPILTSIKSSTNTTNKEDSSDEQIEHETENYGYIGDDEEEVSIDVWRFNGQRVFSVTVSGEEGDRVEVEAIDWRHDGHIVVVLTSDKIIRLVDSFNGKVVHRFSATTRAATLGSSTSPRTRRVTNLEAIAPLPTKSCALSYAPHFSNPRLTQKLLYADDIESSTHVDDVLSLNADINSLLKAPADLPRELATIDVESFLPKLSCLPPLGFGNEDIFSTRTSIDTIFHPSRKILQSGIVNVLTSAHNDGLINARIFDSFEVGTLDLNNAVGLKKVSQIGPIISIASNPFSSETYVIARDAEAQAHLFSLDMRFIDHSSNTLPILATKATQLQNLLRYLTQIQVQLSRELRTAFDLPTRYIRNLDEDLEKQDGLDASFKTASYHAVVTGEVSGAFKEWLNDQLGERGVKRWEKSVSDCFELVRRLVSESWCPAVERAGVVVSRLSGLAGWSLHNNGDRPGLGLDRRLIDGLRNTIDVMAICGEECLKEVIREMTGFASFIKWLKWEVEASGLEDTSEKLDEMRESSEHGDVTRVLEYIDRGPHESAIKRYITTIAPATDDEMNDGAASFYENFKKQRKRESGRKQPPSFDHLLQRMRKQCDSLFAGIADNLHDGMTIKYLAQLDKKTDQTSIDIRIVSEDRSQGGPATENVTIISRASNDTESILQQVFKTGVSQKGARNTTAIRRSPPATDKVLDIKFVDDSSYLVLVKASDSIDIYSHPIEAHGESAWELRHSFKSGAMEAGMTPARLEVNGRKKRRVVGVVDEGTTGYVVLDLDSGDTEENGHDEEMTG